jgi:hypothetical protein
MSGFSVYKAGSTFSNIGALVAVTWDISANASAIVRGWSGAAFGTVAGGETFDIDLDGAGATTVTLTASETSATAVRDKINGTAGLSGVASVSDGAILLSAATSLVVSGVTAALFAKIGIPNLTRDRGETAATSIQMPIAYSGAEVELVSSPVTVPSTANRAAVWVALTAASGSGNEVGGDFALAWGNGTDGETIASIVSVPWQAVLSGTVANESTDSSIGYQKAYSGSVQHIGAAAGLTIPRCYEVTVPPGATKLFLVSLSGRSEDAMAALPYTPPTLSANVAFGAR